MPPDPRVLLSKIKGLSRGGGSTINSCSAVWAVPVRIVPIGKAARSRKSRQEPEVMNTSKRYIYYPDWGSLAVCDRHEKPLAVRRHIPEQDAGGPGTAASRARSETSSPHSLPS